MIHRVHTRAACALIILLVGSGLVGCGAAPDDELTAEALQLHQAHGMRWQQQLQAGDPSARRAAHNEKAAALDAILSSHADASDSVRAVLEAIRDGERQLGSDAVTGEEAQALRDRHEEYWSHLQRGEIPPDYR